MNDIAISVRNVSKQYHIGALKTGRSDYKTLRESLGNLVIGPFRRVGNLLRGEASGVAELDEIIWAVNDVSFDIKFGEVVGIIGRNGAGKSTLLKVLSRITDPTRGEIDIYGRVGSLLEVGTGFHPELTGRENVFLNGAILGMRRQEILKNFDEIVAFSEVGKFIDTPVKHYSSGMYLRLAFAVAAHLETEVLIVDEVLAVGDSSFTSKCLTKMQDVSKQGRTVLFVSHNMQAMSRLCERVIWMRDGQLHEDGPATKVVSNYLGSVLDTSLSELEWPDVEKAPGGDIARLRAVRVRRPNGPVTNLFDVREPFVVEMEYDVLQSGYELLPHFHFLNEESIVIFTSLDDDPAWRGKPRPAGRYKSSVTVPGDLLLDGRILIMSSALVLSPRRGEFAADRYIVVQMTDAMNGDSARGIYTGNMPGMVNPLLHWATETDS